MDVDSTKYMTSVMFSSMTDILYSVSDAVEGAGLQENRTYVEAYGFALSRQVLARGADIYEARDVIDVAKEQSVIGTKLQIIPLIIFAAAMVLFSQVVHDLSEIQHYNRIHSIQVLVVTVRMLISVSGIPYVRLAASHINDPVATVQGLYGRPDPVLSWEDDTTKKFGV